MKLRNVLPGLFTIGALAIAAAGAAPGTKDTGKAVEKRISETFRGDLPEMRKRGFIRALVTYSKTDFFFDRKGLGGFQAALLQEWEKRLNKGARKESERIRIVYVPVPFDRLLPDLVAGKGDVAAALLTITPERERQVSFARGTGLRVAEIVVAGAKAPALKTLEDLSGKTVWVLRGGSYLDSLERLNRDLATRGKPPVIIHVADQHLLSEDLLELANNGVIDYTVVDDFKAGLWAGVLRHLKLYPKLTLRKATPVAWAIRKNNPKLLASLQEHVRLTRKGTMLGNLLFRQYYGNTRRLRNPTSEQARKRFEHLIGLFRKYGKRYGFDALALAAQGFQESGLNQSRKSPRGAIGIMQLLPSTARGKAVGIADIHKVENNIHAGAKYLAWLRDHYLAEPAIRAEDRFALALAAYNAGPAKLRKMRQLARRMGLDPNRWFGHVEVAAGLITGRETVRYVANIFKYYLAYRLMSGIDEQRAKTLGSLRDQEREG